MRLLARLGASPQLCLASEYDFRDEELELGGSLHGFLTAEVPREGSPWTDRGVLLVPGAGGWRSAATRRLAHRLALFCSAMVVVSVWCLSLCPRLIRAE